MSKVEKKKAKPDCKIDLEKLFPLKVKGDYDHITLDLDCIYKALFLEFKKGFSLNFISLLQSMIEEDSLDGFAFDMANAWIAMNKRTAGIWVYTAAGIMGGKKTATFVREIIRKNIDDSKGHYQVLAALEVLKERGSLNDLHEIYAAEFYPSSYAKRRDQARIILDKTAAKLGKSYEQLIDTIIPLETSSDKDKKRIEQVQSYRLERIMVEGRRIQFKDFENNFINHPLLVDLISKTILGIFDKESNLLKTFRINESCPVDKDGKQVTISENDLIGIVHPLEFQESGDLDIWIKIFDSINISQPFPQLERQVYSLPEEQKIKNELDCFYNYDREWLYRQGWYGYLENCDYKNDVDTFAITLKRDKKYIEMKRNFIKFLWAVRDQIVKMRIMVIWVYQLIKHILETSILYLKVKLFFHLKV